MSKSSLADILEDHKRNYKTKVADILDEVYRGTLAQIERVEGYIDSIAQSLEEGSFDTSLNALLANSAVEEDEIHTPAKKKYHASKPKNAGRSPKGKSELTYERYSQLRDKGLLYEDIRAKYPNINYRTIVSYGMGYSRKSKA